MGNNHTQEQEPEAPPDTFVKEVKDALEHLYDLGHLQLHPLTRELGFAAEATTRFAGQHLRQELIAAIEALNPGAGVSFHAPHARLYHVLVLRYVERRTTRSVAQELGISIRQAFRNLRDGQRSVASILWARRSAPSVQEPDVEQLSSFQAEMNHLQSRFRPTDVCLLLRRAQEAVRMLAERRGVQFRAEVPSEPLMISTDATVAQQVLTSALSHAIQQAGPGVLHLALTATDEQVSLVLRYLPEPATASLPVVDARVMRLIDWLGWAVRKEDQAGGTRTFALRIARYGRVPAILVIDDNEGLVKLMQRYLTDRACRVITAANGWEGLRLAQKMAPDAIVLDVMMPEMSGWEVLQRLRNDPQTAAIPVIICSVINDPELAYSLGASIFLPKPVRQEDVLSALHQLEVM